MPERRARSIKSQARLGGALDDETVQHRAAPDGRSLIVGEVENHPGVIRAIAQDAEIAAEDREVGVDVALGTIGFDAAEPAVDLHSGNNSAHREGLRRSIRHRRLVGSRGNPDLTMAGIHGVERILKSIVGRRPTRAVASVG